MIGLILLLFTPEFITEFTALLREGRAVMSADQLPIDRSDGFLVVAGPTASGKSSLCLDIAQQVDGVIINADALQLYRDLDLLSARPDEAALAAAPHALYGVLDGATRCSVGLWLAHAKAAVNDARAAGKIPILVGGTGMYLNASLNGISSIPDVPDEVRREITQMHSALGGQRFHAELATIDPRLAERLAPGDTQRLIRGMEVYTHTKTPLSWWQQQPLEGYINGTGYTIALTPPRDAVYANIERRFDMMFDNGAVGEVEHLIARNLDPGLPVMKALGVSQIADFLSGALSKDDAIMKAKRDSRHYAKRQMTWIRNNFISKITLNKYYSKSLCKKIFPKIFL